MPPPEPSAELLRQSKFPSRLSGRTQCRLRHPARVARDRRVTNRRVAGGSQERPPPLAAAELSEIVEFSISTDPPLYLTLREAMAPPSPAAELPEIVESRIVRSALMLSIAPPCHGGIGPGEGQARYGHVRARGVTHGEDPRSVGGRDRQRPRARTFDIEGFVDRRELGAVERVVR